MGKQNWYAAKLRFVVLLETTGGEEANDSIYLLRSDSFEAAFGARSNSGAQPKPNTSAGPASVSGGG